MRHLFIAAFLCATGAALPVLAAQPYSCSGEAPDWSLEIDDSTAQFQFPALTTMEVVLDTPAEGQDWPRALTLIGDRDTAILVIEREICGETLPYRAHVMTQRGQTPILLTGCCTVSQ